MAAEAARALCRGDESLSLQILRELLREVPLAIAFFDLDLRYVAHSEEWLRAYRLEPSSLIGRRHYDVFPEISDDWRAIHKRCLEGETISRDFDVFERADGRTDYLRWTVMPWLNQQGEISGLAMFTDVVTEQFDTARRLREREGFVNALFEKAHIGLNLCDMDGLWITSNRAILDMIGYSKEEADGRLTYWDLTPREYDEVETEQLAEIEQHGIYGPYEKELIRKDGTRVPVRLNGFTIQQDGKQYIWSFVEDISAERALAAELERERLKVIQAAKLAALGEMAAGIAHEVNNPLALISGYTEVLKRGMESDDMSLLGEAIEQIDDAVVRAARIVAGLRSFARDDAGGELTDVDVRRVLDDVLELHRARLKNRGVELRLSCQEGCVARCRRHELSQVLFNLVRNATQAVEALTVRWIEIACTHVGDHVRIRFTDSGAGIPEDVAARIFDPFFTTKPVGRGTGLGLSIARRSVEDIGGSLVLDANSPHTTFVVTLPKGDPQ